MKGLTIAGLPNPVAALLTELTAGAEGSTMQADALKTVEPTEKARLTSVFPHESWWEADFKVGTAVQALALINHSLVPGDQIRVVGVDGGGSLPPVRSETLPPILVSGSSNFFMTNSPDPELIEEHPEDHDGDTGGPSTLASPWYVHLLMDDPADDPATGGEYQAFLLWVLGNNVIGTPDDYPTVRAELWEDGELRRDLGTKVLATGTPAVGQAVVFPWDASDLETPDGSLVEVRLHFTPGNAAGTYALLDSVSWECVHQSDLDTADYDTGWETIEGAEVDAGWGGTALQRVDLPAATWFRLEDEPLTLTSLRVEIRGDGLGSFDDFQATPPRTPADSIDAGVLVVAPLYEFPYRFSPGGQLRVERKNVGGDSITGSSRAVTQWRRRTFGADFPVMPASEAHAAFARLDWAAGEEVPFLVSIDPQANGHSRRNGTFWSVIGEAGGLSYQPDGYVGGERARGLSYTFVERL